MAKPTQKRPVEAVDGRYGAIPHAVADSAAFMGASHPAKALLLELVRQHSGNNNGHLHLSTSWLADRGWKSRDVVQRAKTELIERQLIIMTRQGGLNMGASRFAITWLPISNYVGLHLTAKQYHRGAWSLMDPLPTCRKIASAVPSDGKGCTGSRNSTSPAGGTVKRATVP